jgi:chemotaxis protein histidine kinase CheA
MTIFCITGFSKESIQFTERILLDSGMSQHLPLERDPSMDLMRWHEKASNAQDLSLTATQELSVSSYQPSRLWQQLAIDLMVANMNSPHWCWAHPGSLQWLDYWAQLESDIGFVLVCEDRASLVCRLVEQGETPESMEGHLALWVQKHQEMLRFNLRNPSKSILVWSSQVQSHPSQLIQQIQLNWLTPLNDAKFSEQIFTQPSSLLQKIAMKILKDQAQTESLDFELQSLIGPSPTVLTNEQIETTDLIKLYGQLQERNFLQDQLILAQHNIELSKKLSLQDQEKIQAESAAKQDALSKLAAEQNKLAAEQKISGSLKKEKEELSTAHKEALAKNKDLQEESDLLLSQLHQVQEELEKYFLLNKDCEEKIKVETLAKQDALSKLAAEQYKLAAEQKASGALKKEKEELSTAHKEALVKNKDLQERLLALQKNIDDAKKLSAQDQEKIKAQTAAIQDALSKLTAEQNKLAAEQKTSSALKKEKEELSGAQKEALAKNKDLQEESDLLLSQLHQVQEELEKYFLLHKERQIEVQRLQDKWKRAVKSYPELHDFEVLELLSESSTDLTAHWRVNQVNVNGAIQGPFEFKTLVENGVTGLVFSKDDKGRSPLQRWPLIAAKEKQLTIIPIKGKDDPQKRSATILQLGSTDWDMVHQLTKILDRGIGNSAFASQIGQRQVLLDGIKNQLDFLSKVPALLRFDDIKLFGQQNTELKSVIGLRLTHADLQGLKCNSFEFQLQLNIKAGSDITSAHFIFDEKTKGVPLEKWTHNVKSSAGKEVMALQLGSKGWDPQLWRKLSPLDQLWLQNTVRVLPFMLVTLQHQGVKLEKGWNIWAQAVTELVNWSNVAVTSQKSKTASKNQTPPQLQPPGKAPVPPKVTRKTKQSKDNVSKPKVAVKVSTTAKVAAKPTGKTPVRSAVASKTKRRAS